MTLIGEAVFSRCLSALKEERVEASKLLSSPEVPEEFQGDRDAFLQDLRDGLFASKIVSYAQGFTLIQEASREFGWYVEDPNRASQPGRQLPHSAVGTFSSSFPGTSTWVQSR